MKRIMKFMVMTLVVAMLLSMAAFAAEVTCGDIIGTANGDDYDVVINYNASAYSAGDQITMLVLTGADSIQFAADGVTPTNVAYIDQQAIAGATGSFTFKVAKSFIVENEIFVKLGATAKTSAATGEYTFTTGGGTDPQPPAGDDDVVIETTVTDAFDVTGLKIMKVSGTDGTKTLTVAGADVVFVKNGETPYYFVISAADVTAADFVWSDVAPVEALIGNANGDDTVNIFDATAALETVASGTDSLTDVQKFLSDANTDGSINIFDATSILEIVAGATPPVFGN